MIYRMGGNSPASKQCGQSFDAGIPEHITKWTGGTVAKNALKDWREKRRLGCHCDHPPPRHASPSLPKQRLHGPRGVRGVLRRRVPSAGGESRGMDSAEG